ncbi:restriction modification system DNA specificity subunit [Candidatus Mycoplasma haematolamae str. Purdue]|uniref:Restriction modification system DNA specificity subunit n=1 Tax=Mycoplasma haematolamae (strain Purdue) TaxID=1212765 RepID=I7B906_MYCHA|nr:restriction endonuclease subunit S [Candidatus Mycoplasma haematolamae]AFO51735.1 restriction modification system DNA specificity subunit [Candidatus Mycoplasma haematolamae str. Purdue]
MLSLLDLYKKAVLKEAFEGKLTANWRKAHPEHSPLKDFESIRLKRQKFKDTNLDEHEIELDLPESWLRVRIGEVFVVEIGATPSRKVKEYWNGTINWVKSGEILFKNIYETEEKITKLGCESSSLRLFPENTVVLSLYKGGESAILKCPSTINQAVAAISVSETPCVPEYLFYYFQLICGIWEFKESGTSVLFFNKEKVRSLHIPFTSFEEQREVVREIEKRFSLVEELEGLVEKVSLLKKSCLKEGLGGQLTANWRDRNEGRLNPLEDYRTLSNKDPIGRELEIKDKQFDWFFPASWLRVRIGDVLTVDLGTTPNRQKKEYWGGNINWIRSGEVNYNYIEDSVEKITERCLREVSLSVHPRGTLIIGKTDTTIGRAAILKVPCAHSTDAAALMTAETPIPPEFLFYFCMLHRHSLFEMGYGSTGRRHLTKKLIQDIEFPFPSFEEQREIVKELNAIFSICEALESLIGKSS